MSSSSGKNGGDTLGRFVKLFGNTAFWVAAIAEAFNIANGFLPVKVELPDPVPTKLLVPDDLSLSLIIFLFKVEFPSAYPLAFVLEPPLFELEFVEDDNELLVEPDRPGTAVVTAYWFGPLVLISGCNKASNLNCSILYSVSLIFSLGY